jgi:SAM-dependent methyltransferase
VIYQHPLAYLLGLEGLALLRSWAGDYDKAFVEARLAEVRRLLADKGLTNHPGVVVTPSETAAAYDQWSKTYDEPRNNLFDFDEPIMHEILDAQPPGIVLDAACGTGRYAAYLASQGHQVIGVDCSAEMLARARAQVDQARFVLGDLHQLPLRAAAVDVVVCALALAHVPALEPVMAEFARVLRPAGHLVISDVHHELVFRGSVIKAVGPTGQPAVVPTYRHTPGDFLRAALPAGFEVRRCEEPRFQVADESTPLASEIAIGPWEE